MKKHVWSRLLACLLSLVLVMSMLAGCGRSADSKAGDTGETSSPAAESISSESSKEKAPSEPMSDEDFWEYMAAQSYAYLSYSMYPQAVAIYDRLPEEYRKMDQLYDYARVMATLMQYDEDSKYGGIGYTHKHLMQAVDKANANPEDAMYQFIAFNMILKSDYLDAFPDSFETLYEVTQRFEKLYPDQLQKNLDEEGDKEIQCLLIRTYLRLYKYEDGRELARQKWEETGDVTYRDLLISSYKEAQDYDGLHELTEELMAAGEPDMTVLSYAAQAAMKRGEYDRVVDLGLRISEMAQTREYPAEYDQALFQFVNYLCMQDDALYEREHLACYTLLSDEQLNKLESDDHLALYIRAFRGIFRERLEDEKEDDTEQALTDIDKLLSAEPDNAYLLYMKAALLHRTEQYEQALSYAEKALEENPGDAMFFFTAASSAEAVEDWEKAYNYSYISMEMNPWSGSYYHDYYGISLHASYIHDEAERHLYPENDIKPLEFENEDAPAYLEVMTKMEEAGDKDTDAYRFMELMETMALDTENKEIDQTRDMLRSLTDEDSFAYYIAWSNWDHKYDGGRYQTTIWNQALTTKADWDYANMMMGLATLKRKDYPAATYYFQLAYALNPDNVYAVTMLGLTYFYQRNHDLADFYLDIAEEMCTALEEQALEAEMKESKKSTFFTMVAYAGSPSKFSALANGVRNTVKFTRDTANETNVIDTTTADSTAWGVMNQGVNAVNTAISAADTLNGIAGHYSELKGTVGSSTGSLIPNSAIPQEAKNVLGGLGAISTAASSINKIADVAGSQYRETPFLEHVSNIITATQGSAAVVGAVAQGVGFEPGAELAGYIGDIAGAVSDFVNDPAVAGTIKEAWKSTGGDFLDQGAINVNWFWTTAFNSEGGLGVLKQYQDMGYDVTGSHEVGWSGDSWTQKQIEIWAQKLADAIRDGDESQIRDIMDHINDLEDHRGGDNSDDGDGHTPNPDNLVCKKPNIYLYPAEETPIQVTLGRSDLITASDPFYGQGWSVSASPDGTLTDDQGERFGYLFYECLVDRKAFETKGGFYLPAKDRENVLKGILTAYDFNETEISDFLEFWLTELDPDTDYRMIPQTQDMVDGAMPITISKKPDHLYRIWFGFAPVGDGNEKGLTLSEISKGIIVPICRDGFSIVEWGGAILP